MPSLSPTMMEGKIVKWLKKEGDVISPGDVICDIETDKAVVSMEVEEEGVLAKIIVPENSPLIKVGTLIAVMVEEGEDWKNVDISSVDGAEASDSLDKSSSSSSSSSSDSDTEAEPTISGPPTIPIKMPSLSPTMTAGTIVKWLKKEGDKIAPGDVLCDIQTDKAVMSLETEEEGILAKILVSDDSKEVSVGTLIALIVGENEDWKSVKVSDFAPKPAGKSIPQIQSVSTSTSSGDMRSKIFGPAVKYLLAAYQIESGLIKATGRNNRLLKEDVLKYIEDNRLEKKPPKTVSAPTGQVKTTPGPANTAPEKQKSVPKGVKVAGLEASYTDIQLSSERQAIAQKLAQSKREIPHNYSLAKCDITKVMEAVDALAEEGVKISLNELITKATATALQMYPRANAICVNNEIKISREVHINVTTPIDNKLFTTTVRSANLKNLQTISDEFNNFSIKAKSGEVKPEDTQVGTFMISNLNELGVKQFNAIINPPQCAVLAVGSTIETIDVDLSTKKYIILNLSYDRRALEDQEAAEFMNSLKYFIENPKILMLDVERKRSEMGL